MPKRPCLDCARLTRNASRCDACTTRFNVRRGSATQRGYGSDWRRVQAQALAQHVQAHGNWCPGYGMLDHLSDDLTVDHITALSRGGANTLENAQVLCRSCNSRKHNS